MPTKKHPHPLDAKQPAREGTPHRAPTARPLRDHGTHIHTPAATGHGTGRGTIGAQGHAWGARTTHANEATRRTFTTASDSEHSSISAKQQRKSSSRETNSNDIEHSTLRHGHAELSDATTQRKEHSTLQATVNTAASMTRRHERSNAATRQRNAKNTAASTHDAHKGCDSTGEQSASHKPTTTVASTR